MVIGKELCGGWKWASLGVFLIFFPWTAKTDYVQFRITTARLRA